MPQRTIAVIDGNSLMHRAFHALPETMTAPDGRPTNAAFGFLQMLIKLVQDLKPYGVVVAFDRGKPAFRIEALAQYKIHRPPTADALRSQFPMMKELLGALDVPVVELDGWEGDDILGTLARRGEAAGLEVLLVTGDRDAFQLVSDHVKVVTTRKGITDITVYGPLEVEERYGITPAQVPDYLGLKGDTSDNIPGVPGVGEKTAAKLLQQYGTLEAVLTAAKAGEVPGKVGANLVEHEGAALASRTVATIVCDVPVAIELDTVRFGVFELAMVAEAFATPRCAPAASRHPRRGRPSRLQWMSELSATCIPACVGVMRRPPSRSGCPAIRISGWEWPWACLRRRCSLTQGTWRWRVPKESLWFRAMASTRPSLCCSSMPSSPRET
ncbi:MAG: hypothetical protein CVT67_11980 [Actinobacteria bacterium HGW-Actinobacteria-7]|nr:MAG: hypothetical protein CVT67_11980 [Actinobacteria bacterium HGW-Actinobacteria-7]